MSEYYPFCPHRPCPICGDTSGDCSISEYGYALLCCGFCEPEVKEGDLRGFWKCFRSNEDYSQWEDQRTRLEMQVKTTPHTPLTFCTPAEEPFEINEENSERFCSFIEKILHRAIKRYEGKGGEA